ncbi:DJ-1/PfpI family protein [Ornithinibacillus bavariensis]|uniref:DJ-1/PfpI domain-containing protein n=1 Tax=Ornithinibacillus bavariensis TaxID=545502 RepID=A0A919XB39_9BACI|nr:DJ-1/PfpI family protein [Ornithinibacillus bavariensis]GIO28163.1 hypothetical protein J43TS3_27740 [Ornithinibacillus bavariensis]
MHVQIILFDGFDLLDAIAPYEVFTAAAMYAKEEVTVKLVSAEGERMVTSGVNQLKLRASEKLVTQSGGIILVPGASGSVDANDPDAIPVKLQRATETELSDLLTEAFHNPDILLSTVCGGSLILAMIGLLEGRYAVSHHMGMDLLSTTGANAIHARVVDDGDLITGGGVTSGLDLALYLVERELGPRIAHAVEQLFEYERRGTIWRAEGNAPNESQKEDSLEAPILESSNQINELIDFQGVWDTTISTPIGKLSVLLHLSAENGRIVGTARQGKELVTLDNPVLEGNTLKWTMKVTKPMHLTLKFTVTVDGNEMHGVAKAGMLPSSKLSGHRIS